MPIYEYHCAKCNSNFDHFARTSSDQPKKCPECGSRRVKKQFAAFATTKTFQMASGYGKRAQAAASPSAPTAPSAAACPASESCKKKCYGEKK